MERITSISRLRQSCGQAWTKQWSSKIIKLAEREKSSNSRLRKIIQEEMTDGMFLCVLACILHKYMVFANKSSFTNSSVWDESLKVV